MAINDHIPSIKYTGDVNSSSMDDLDVSESSFNSATIMDPPGEERGVQRLRGHCGSTDRQVVPGSLQDE